MEYVKKVKNVMRKLLFRILRKLMRKPYQEYTEDFVELFNQEANDYVREQIHNASNGLLVAKWGTVELGTVCTVLSKELKIRFKDICEGKVGYDKEHQMSWLCNNAGFFPNNVSAGIRFAKMALEDAQEIDVLGSYIQREFYVQNYVKNAKKINLNGYYAPFLWENPWTKELKGKKVLVVHPFAETIRSQYARREKLFTNSDVLPEFKSLTVIKAVQSIAGNGTHTGFKDWFEALEYMKKKIDNVDYDIALIGCGAYGMALAAHAKRKGKIAVHLAGWTQMLFGIYGKRWLEDQPQYKEFINEYWVRPNENERPQNADSVEGGCYW